MKTTTLNRGEQSRRSAGGFKLHREEYCEYKLEGDYCIPLQEHCIYTDARFCGHRLNYRKLRNK